MTANELILDLQRQGFVIAATPQGKLLVSPSSKLPAPIREELRQSKAEILALLNKRDEDEFIAKHVPPAVSEVFPWRGLLVKSDVLGMSVWIVRNRSDGADLSAETGDPALLLDDVLRLKGRSKEEVRSALLPLFIISQKH